MSQKPSLAVLHPLLTPSKIICNRIYPYPVRTKRRSVTIRQEEKICPPLRAISRAVCFWLSALWLLLSKMNLRGPPTRSPSQQISLQEDSFLLLQLALYPVLYSLSFQLCCVAHLSSFPVASPLPPSTSRSTRGCAAPSDIAARPSRKLSKGSLTAQPQSFSSVVALVSR